MFSVIEIGNTTGKIVQFDTSIKVKNSVRVPIEQFSEFDRMNFLDLNPDVIIAGSGSPTLISEICQQLAGMELSVTLVDKQAKLPFVNRYTPGQAGVDRLANVAAVIDLNLAPCIIVDAGSAITVDLVSSRKEFLGGSIMPGIQMQARSLNTGTAALPLVFTSPEEKTNIPTNTADAIQNGIIQGTIGAIMHLVTGARLQLESTTPVIFTGGDGSWLCSHCQLNYSSYSEHLTAIGLYKLARYQKPGSKSTG